MLTIWGDLDVPPLVITMVNCTIAYNRAEISTGALWVGSSDTRVTLANCVLWNNDAPIAPEIRFEDVDGCAELLVLTHSDVKGGLVGVWISPGCEENLHWGDGMIDLDPGFASGPSGTWTADGSFDAENHQVTFTDAGANWTEGELVEKLVQPFTDQVYQYPIIANTATTMTIWADWDSIDVGQSTIVSGDC